MYHHERGARGILTRLDAAACWRLVGDMGLGRVGFMGDSQIRIVPTMYDAEGHTAYFRASRFGELARGVDDRLASLQVDEVDRTTFTGWSVLMTGRAHRVDDAARVASLWSPGRPHPWLPGPELQWIELVVDAIEGQRVA